MPKYIFRNFDTKQVLFRTEAANSDEAVENYRKELGAEAVDYDAVDPDWLENIDVEIEED